jgi:hypothetical protein
LALDRRPSGHSEQTGVPTTASSGVRVELGTAA